MMISLDDYFIKSIINYQSSVICYQFINQGGVVLGGVTFGGMLEDVEVMPLALLYLYALAHTRIEEMRAPCIFEDVDGLTGYTGTLVTLDNEKTTHDKVFVYTTLDGCVGIKHVANTIYG